MLKIALIHEWFTTYAGSERVTEQLLHIYPDADVFSLIDILTDEEKWFIGRRAVTTSFLQKYPFIRKHYRSYLPLMPLAIEQFDLSKYNLVISNCHAVSKGVITSPEQLHVSYIQSPMRYVWDLQATYFSGGSLKNAIIRPILHYIRMWDYNAAQRPDRLIANSQFISRRIEKYYRRPSTVIHPPVDTDYYIPNGSSRGDFYLTASRFVPYKRIDLILDAFKNMPEKKLVVIGDGPDAHKMKHLAAANITWLGYLPRPQLRDYLRECKAFIFASKEDFGIIPVEAQACGAPVIAFGEGGAVDTINDIHSPQPSGIFFGQQTAGAIQAAVAEFESNLSAFSPDNCRKNAERFSIVCFQKIFRDFISSACRDFFSSNHQGGT